MGGASTQITFIPTTGNILANKFAFRMAGKLYAPYVHSFLYYGQQYAFRWVLEHLHRDNPTATTLQNPCMLSGGCTYTLYRAIHNCQHLHLYNNMKKPMEEI